MGIEVSSPRSVCSKCGADYSRQKGYFPVSYAQLHKGVGHTHVCKDCIDGLYNTYLSQCNNAPDAVRQVCRKLDLYWNEGVFGQVERKSTTRTMMTQYITKINSVTYAGKSYDDTLSEEGTLWWFKQNYLSEDVEESAAHNINDNQEKHRKTDVVGIESIELTDEVIDLWGPGYTPEMYAALEQRRKYWVSKLPEGIEFDIGTEALIKQICSLELDINRDRAAGRAVDKSINALNSLLGSASLKPTQKKNEDMDTELANTPMGVWLYRYENKRPLPEIDSNLKDVNGTKKYMFTWMGHLCKMLGIKNGYTKMYEEEINRLRVEKPEYDDEDDETLLYDFFNENSGDKT